MFRRVLIANRGEIACRIQRTLRRIGVESVAVFSEPDRTARYVLEADHRVAIGPGPAAESYLNSDAILAAARASGADAIHPGYGFLSERAEFAAAVEAAGMAFVGPTPEQIRSFGLKHAARALAEQAGVPLSPGSGLLASVSEAQTAAARIGFPLMLKSTAGGGGIGMQVVHSAADLASRYESVMSLARKNFGDGGVFLEKFVTRARHVEVQIFGDGRGNVISLGERDCSLQRRNQKVVEEAPAPNLGAQTRQALNDAALKLAKRVAYRSAGTVEFIYDSDTEEFCFLEVNTRLQVEHGVTELVTGIDLVEWMLRLAAGDAFPLSVGASQGHAIEARIYAEDPARDFRPCAGLLSHVAFPTDARVDAWVETGTRISPFYDPMLGKLLVHAPTRAEALSKLEAALSETAIAGVETNLGYLSYLCREPAVRSAQMTTGTLGSLEFRSPTFEVLAPGTFTTIQESPGRVGYWNVGIPPSGPMDDLSFRLANRIVGNAPGTAGLEITLSGPTLLFATDATIALTGAALPATLDGAPVEYFTPIHVRAGQQLAIGALKGPGCRAYLALRNGLDVPSYLGSRATFTLGGFGGHAGRTLQRGDVLHLGSQLPERAVEALAPELVPHIDDEWEICVMYGPHGAPDFFTEADIREFFEARWQVHFNSARTGVRLIGPKPKWARADGGEAGLHPSNIHDNAYAFGTVDFTGDMPIILGPDGPSLGGFVCPATVVSAELWKLGQLKAGARVRFKEVSAEQAAVLEHRVELQLAGQTESPLEVTPLAAPVRSVAPFSASPTAALVKGPEVSYRPAGDKFLLVEYGAMVLELSLRFRVHVLMQHLLQLEHPAILELTPGIRSLQIHYDSRRLPQRALLELLGRAEAALPDMNEIEVPTRTVRLPLSWDDPATQLAIERYAQGVRKDAPWVPSNIEFIRRINGLKDEEAVKRIVFEARYLVLGLGDVYLGAPVATPIDPRHRLVTTKYNPARTWTPENAVGIGGAYLCVYGMEGPGGYQFVGRTIQMFNRHQETPYFSKEQPWLLRFFDQIQFYPVSAEELLDMRERFPLGRFDLQIEAGTFRLADYQRQLQTDAADIAAFKQRQQEAFEAERQRWQAAETMQSEINTLSAAIETPQLLDATALESPVHGSVWRLRVAAGSQVQPGQLICILESMKMEISVEATEPGTIAQILVREGDTVAPGQVLVTYV